jgi:VanZ family protein
MMWNLAHVPIFAVVTFLWFRAIAGGRPATGRTYMLAFVASVLSAVLDEWHQSFVPGRMASVSDFGRDLIGIIGMLVALRSTQEIVRRRRQAYS